MTNKRLLALSGGGVKGYAQVQVLKKLEEDNGPLHDYYDLVIGASVGAIDAAILASGKKTMTEFEDGFPEMAKKIFKKRRFFSFRKFPKYQRKNFMEIWDELIGLDFKMKDVKTKLMVLSVDLVTNKNRFFKSWHDDDGEERLVDIVMRSFAAPMFFGQLVDEKNKACWSDGGSGFDNLPLEEAKITAEVHGWYQHNQIQIDAIGCLFQKPTNTFKKQKKNRMVRQVFDFMNPMEGGLARAQSRQDQVDTMVYQAQKISNISFRYWDTTCSKKLDGLDKLKYMDKYKELGILMSSSPLIEVGSPTTMVTSTNNNSSDVGYSTSN